MSKDTFPVTTAIRALKDKAIEYVPHIYDYEEKGGTAQTAAVLNVDEHSVIKTLVFTADGEQIIVLMHGDNEVSTKELARQINCKKIEQPAQAEAMKATGYQFGGTSPFGTKKPLRIYAEESILSLSVIYINGGKRGFILEMSVASLEQAISIQPVNVAIRK